MLRCGMGNRRDPSQCYHWGLKCIGWYHASIFSFEILLFGLSVNSFPSIAEGGSYQLPPDDQQVVRENLLESMIRYGGMLGRGLSEKGRRDLGPRFERGGKHYESSQRISLPRLRRNPFPLSIRRVRAPHMVQSQLGEVFKTIVYADFPEKWPTLPQGIFPNLVSQVHRCWGLGQRGGFQRRYELGGIHQGYNVSS